MRHFGIAGASSSGKTTAIAALLPVLRAQGLRVSTVEHAHHGFDMDRPGNHAVMADRPVLPLADIVNNASFILSEAAP